MSDAGKTAVTTTEYRPIAERPAVDAATFLAEVAAGEGPVVLRGQAAHWPAVRTAAQGGEALAEMLLRYAGGRPLDVMVGPPSIAGRFFYADDRFDAFNFQRQQVALTPLLDELKRLAGDAAPAPAIYANSATAADHLPGWEADHPIDLPIDAPARLWIGNAVQVATHFDTSHNVAVVVGGRRRFTIFPPDQLENLYVGPLDVTPAGQPISLVDPDAPDLIRFPRFEAAMAAAQSSELGPGDALYLPPLWWHHVRSLDPINVLANYWWGHQSGAAFTALIHAVLAVRDVPEAERSNWRRWFDQLVFAPDAARAADHLPSAARSVLGAPSEARRQHITAFLIRMLQRG